MSVDISWLLLTIVFASAILTIFYYGRAIATRAAAFLKHHQAYNNFVIATCALATLIWGAYSFDALQQKKIAEAELAAIQKRIRDTESTLLSVKVKVDVLPNEYYLTPTVTIKNQSSEMLYFSLCPDSLAISKISYSYEAQARAEKTIYPLFYERVSEDPKIKNNPIYDIRVPVSSERSLSFFAAVKAPGVYYVTFSALSSNDPNTNSNSGKCSFRSKTNIAGKNKINGKDSIWFASSYVIINPKQ